MAARAIWKGSLVFGELVCQVALHAAASTSDRVSFHILNRETGHRVSRVYIDAETGKPVDREDQVKGYDTEDGKTVILEPEEVAAAVPESDKVLHLEAFVSCADVETLYFDRPYYLTAADEAAETAFAVIRDGLSKRKVAAVVRAVLFRRVRSLAIRADGEALIAHTLEYGREVRDADAAFKDVASPKTDKEMLELAEHIIKTKRGKFDPSRFEDRYDDALAELVKAKAVGKPRRRLHRTPCCRRSARARRRRPSHQRRSRSGRRRRPRHRSSRRVARRADALSRPSCRRRCCASVHP